MGKTYDTENGMTVSCYLHDGEYLLEIVYAEGALSKFGLVDCPAVFDEDYKGQTEYTTHLTNPNAEIFSADTYAMEFSHIQAGGLKIDRGMMMKMVGLDGLAFIEQQASTARNKYEAERAA